MAAKPFGIVTKGGSFVSNDILRQYAVKAEPRKLRDAFNPDYGAEPLIKPLYNPEQLAKLLEINTYHYRAVKTKARDTAGLGWELAPLSDDAGDDLDPASQVAQDFLDGLTPPLTLMLDKAQTDYEAIGWAALEAIRVDYNVDGPLSDLEHIPAHTIRLHRDDIRILQKRGNRKRWFKRFGAQYDVNADTGDVAPLGSIDASERATEILYWYNYTPRSDYYGLPDVMPALGAIQGEIARRDYNIAFFDNFGVPAYAVFITGNYDPGDELAPDADGVVRNEMEAAIEEHFQGLAKNPHSTLILGIPGTDVKVEFKPLSVEVKEASFRMYRMDNRDEVLAAHGVPPYRAGISETGSLGGSTAQETTEIYKRSVIEPRQSMLEHIITQSILVNAFGVTLRKFKLSQIDTTDEKHDMELTKSLFDMGAIDAADVRLIWAARFGLSPDLPLSDAEQIADNLPAEALESAVEQMYQRVMKRRERAIERLRLVAG